MWAPLNTANKCYNLQASGDYIGMALRNNVLLCTYKLSGTVHQVETSQLTIGSGKASSFDRVVFRRYKQRRQSHSLQLWLKLTLALDCAPTVQTLPRRWRERYAELHIQGAPEPPSQTQPPRHHQQPPQAGSRQPGVLRGRLSRKLYSNQLWKFSIFSLSVTDLLKVLLQNQIFHAMKTNKEDIKYMFGIQTKGRNKWFYPSFLPFSQPPVELRYPGYSGAMELSYINDMPVSLLNYKRINNFDAEKSAMK